MIADEDLAKAIDRLAHTPDGHLLYRYLQKILMGVLAGAPGESALTRNEGRRSLAAELMGLMAKGIDESGSTDTPADTRASERPVVFVTRGAVAVNRRATYREHAARTDPELTALRHGDGT